MIKIDMLVKAPHFYTMQGNGVGYLENGVMAVDKGKILAIGSAEEIESQYEGEEVLNLEHHAVLPGFIDCHMHTGDCILRGLAQDTGYWMMYGLQPFMNGCNSTQREAGSRLAIVEALKSGTTTLGDYETNMDPICQFIQKIGARGNITSTIREATHRTYAPGELYEFEAALGEKSLQENLELYDKWHNKADGRIRVLFGPQGVDFLSPELLKRVYTLAQERNTKVHMHVQQGDRETYQIVKRYGKRPIAFLDELGLLNDTLIAVHLTDARAQSVSLTVLFRRQRHSRMPAAWWDLAPIRPPEITATISSTR